MHRSEDRLLGETMMHVVPTCPSPTPSLTSSPDSPISFEFDLNLLPSSDCSDFVGNLDLPLPLSSLTDPFQEVPSPTASFSQLETNLQSPMMFSPVNGDKTQLYNWLEPSTSSPISLPPSSPYSPAGRPNRLSSTDSGLMTEGSSVSSIQDSLMELNELRSQFKLEQVSGPPPPYVMPHGQIVPKTEPQSSVDHPLLRQVLEDFSFDQKFAPKFEDNDFQVKSELDDSLSEVKLNPVISLAMEQVKKDIETTCQILHISQDPSRWSRNDVMRWMEWTMQTFNLEPVTPIQEWVTEGQFMVQMTEQQFKEKIPQGGDLMYAQLDVWRSTANCQQDEAVVVPQMQPETRNSVYDPSISINDLMSMMVEEEAHQSGTQNFDSELTSRNDHLLSPPPYPSERTNPSTDFQMEDEDDDASSERDFGQPSVAATIQTPPTPNRSSTNIHLWQFVKELLNEPHLHSGCIHWVDKDKGIFKIVDSVRVAHLWGKRKNRPAMNYDKLSRSLRQYYKKGIMKKTERTQRLVYQFCSPYHH